MASGWRVKDVCVRRKGTEQHKGWKEHLGSLSAMPTQTLLVEGRQEPSEEEGKESEDTESQAVLGPMCPSQFSSTSLSPLQAPTAALILALGGWCWQSVPGESQPWASLSWPLPRPPSSMPGVKP